MTNWIALGLQTLTLLGVLAGIYARLSSRLTAIETQIAERDRTAAQREELYARRTEDAVETFCRDRCLRAGTIGGSNPGIQS